MEKKCLCEKMKVSKSVSLIYHYAPSEQIGRTGVEVVRASDIESRKPDKKYKKKVSRIF